MKCQNLILMQAQVKWDDFIFNLEYRLPLYQEGYHMNCQQNLNTHIAYKLKWDEWNTMTLYTTHLAEPRKIRQSGFSKRVSDFSGNSYISNFRCSGFYCLVLNG
jgi:hypothetical protein